MPTKSELRKRVKAHLSALTTEEKREMSVKASIGCIFQPFFEGARSLFVFCSTADEPSTRPLITAALQKGKKVYLPRIEGGMMVCVPYREGEDFALNEYGILEPTAEAAPCSEALSVDIAIVPLLAFDKDKHRLGRGKGYYDRFLSAFKGVKVGYAFSVQECDDVPTEAHDVALDYIVTEKDVF